MLNLNTIKKETVSILGNTKCRIYMREYGMNNSIYY